MKIDSQWLAFSKKIYGAFKNYCASNINGFQLWILLYRGTLWFWPKFDIYSHFYSFIKFLAILWRIWTLQFSSIAKMVQLFSENCHCHIWSKYSQNFWPFMTNIWPRENARSNPIILTCDAVMGIFLLCLYKLEIIWLILYKLLIRNIKSIFHLHLS